MRAFVYGTLMAEEVLHGLLGRVPCIRTAAALPNFVRYGVRGLVFPAIIPRDGASTSGLLLDGLTDREVRWLDWFEDNVERGCDVRQLLEPVSPHTFPRKHTEATHA